MKRLSVLLFLILLSVPCVAASRTKAGDVGIGVTLGEPTGPTLKYWRSRTQAFDVGIGFSSDMILYGDYLWHGWDVFPKPTVGSFAGYLGLGGRYRNRHHEDDELGIRTVAGMSYYAAQTPVEVFLEIVPVFQISPHTDTDIDAVIGLRYYVTGF